MDNAIKIISLAVGLNLILTVQTFAGPPFLTDDPEPVDYQHWEFYLFGIGDHTSVSELHHQRPGYGIKLWRAARHAASSDRCR